MASCPGTLVETADGTMRCTRGVVGCLVDNLRRCGDEEEFLAAHRWTKPPRA